MVIGREGEEPIYYFIDWDDVAFGPVLDDLAGFLNYQNSPCHTDDFADFGYGRKETEELALVERYWECVKGSPLVPEELEECLMMYKYYKLMHTIRCICFHSECFIQSQFGEVSEGEIRRAIPVAIKLAKELRIM
jgi:Ser/Thr protein kinase RdoA (MazF antagonist)